MIFFHRTIIIALAMVAAFFSISLVYAQEPEGVSSASSSSFLSLEQAPESWQPERNDRFIADTKTNIGYLTHSNHTYVSFPIVTGQRRTVRYLGMTYNATTPEAHWTVKEKMTQWDRTTFGSKGLFLRLYRGDSELYSKYGIHTHRDIDAMIDGSLRFRSMGCILVTQPILDLVERTLDVNGGTLSVDTKYDVDISHDL